MARNRERIRVTLTEAEQDACARILMKMNSDPKLVALPVTIHMVARQALDRGLSDLIAKYGVKSDG